MINPDLLSNTAYLATIALLCIGFATSSAHAETKDEMNEQFAVGAGGVLIVDVNDGDVEVSTHNGEGVTVQVLRKARAEDAESEREILEAHEVKIERDGEKVSVWARMREDYNERMQKSYSYNRNLSVRFIIVVPSRFTADLKSSDGNISVQGLQGDLSARSSDGDFELEGVRGTIGIRSSDGNLVLRACAGTLKADTSDGDIVVDDFDGPVSLQTSDGTIHVQGTTRTVQAQSSDGDVNVSFAVAPDGDCHLQTSDGSVIATLGKGMALSSDGKTGDGRIKSELPIAGELKKSRVRGDINGGGPTLSLRTSDGDITLKEK
jgi:DUF4097 and DUF4098 domain-containing protein YvlB